MAVNAILAGSCVLCLFIAAMLLRAIANELFKDFPNFPLD